MSTILVLSHPRLSERLLNITSSDITSDFDISIKDVPFGDIMNFAPDLLKIERPKLVLTAGAHWEMISPHVRDLNIDVVPMKITGLDMVQTIIEAKKFGKRIGYVYYNHCNVDYREICESLGVTVREYPFVRESEIQNTLERIVCSDVDVVIGTSAVCQIADMIGIPNVLIHCIDSLREELAVARRFAQYKTSMTTQFQSWIVKHSHEACAIVDLNGQITHSNEEARNLLAQSEIQLAELVQQQSRQEELEIPMHTEHGLWTLNISPIILGDNMNVGYNAVIRSKTQTTTAPTINNFIYQSKNMDAVVNLVRKFSASLAPVLIFGETGTGKEMIAQMIHECSNRRDHPFIAINCGAIPENIIESELFGYVDGAFTGAARGGKKGFFEAANGGTLFLDEIGELSPSVQTKLLRVLQEGTITPVGARTPIRVNVRVVGATNKNLRSMITDDAFRADLYYRLNALEVRLPALRDRLTDIPLLLHHFLSETGVADKLIIRILNTMKTLATNYAWPGNIRELRNLCVRLSALIDEQTTDLEIVEIVKEYFQDTHLAVQDISENGLYQKLDAYESAKIQDVLSSCATTAEAAEQLGISRTTLWRKRKKMQPE